MTVNFCGRLPAGVGEYAPTCRRFAGHDGDCAGWGFKISELRLWDGDSPDDAPVAAP